MQWIASKAPSEEERRKNEYRATSPWDTSRFKPWLTRRHTCGLVGPSLYRLRSRQVRLLLRGR